MDNIFLWGEKYIVEAEEYPVETNEMDLKDFEKLYKFQLFMYMILFQKKQ